MTVSLRVLLLQLTVVCALGDARSADALGQQLVAFDRHAAPLRCRVKEMAEDELLLDLNRNVTCEGAYSLFSCGSLVCPKTLYELRDGAWVAAGSIAAASPQQLRLGRAAAADGHRTLEVCGNDACSERSTYEWRGMMYVEAARSP